ncbi:hypothetical protein GUJ93_ZPchr0012g19555 [Zizania palustris]|uniref:Uncharacterized protein n=1 Tax=Zizania palustris TaxID=103762 RepID=A0A8J5WT47_ZIZPA|nr:hypothetical protein GUJ93_ZPchr0012g19555 [Zizania palustris]
MRSSLSCVFGSSIGARSNSPNTGRNSPLFGSGSFSVCDRRRFLVDSGHPRGLDRRATSLATDFSSKLSRSLCYRRFSECFELLLVTQWFYTRGTLGGGFAKEDLA